MRTGIFVIALIFMIIDWGGRRNPAHSAPLWTDTGMSSLSQRSELLSAAASRSSNPTPETHNSTARVDFDTQIKPMLQSRCMPCHFNGGAQYEKLPFDRPETIKKLATKLFTRINDEDQRRLIRDFLAQ
jgi:hypothetical protein